jgi:hypothetical protein
MKPTSKPFSWVTNQGRSGSALDALLNDNQKTEIPKRTRLHTTLSEISTRSVLDDFNAYSFLVHEFTVTSPSVLGSCIFFREKEVISMTYGKPELLLLADARVAIQANDGTGQKEGGSGDSMPLQTPGAYEADE